MELGAKHVESPFIEFGQICTVIYFAHFLVIVPLISLLENSLTEIASTENKIAAANYPYHLVQASLLSFPESSPSPDNSLSLDKLASPDDSPYDRETQDHIENLFPDGIIHVNMPDGSIQTYGVQPDKTAILLITLEQGDTGPQPEQPQPQPQPEQPQPQPEQPQPQQPQRIAFSPVFIDFIFIFINIFIIVSGLTLIFTCVDLSIFTLKPLACDAPRPWGIYFQDSATPQMEGLVELHDNILFYLVIILFGVGWLLISIVKNYTNTEAPISHKYLSHGTLIELIWTITPALILILIAFPSFKLLYLMDEVSDPAMAVLAEGHQWYWSYQYPDFLNNDDEFIEFDSYLIPESDLEDGALRMLEVDNRLIIPELTHVRFIVTGADVIHSLACPALGIKCDAYPGRLNQVSVMVNREGTFYGLRP